MAASDIRYGISALMTDYYNYAIDDELMVSKSTGKIYYKREDGRVVSTSENIEQGRLCHSIEHSFSENGLTINDNDFAVYHMLNMSDKINMRSNAVVDLGIEDSFPITNNVNGFMIRLHGTDEANASVAIIDSIAKSNVTNPTVAEFKFNVYKSNGVIESRVANIPFNKLCFIPISNTTGQDLTIIPKSIQYKNFETAYGTYVSSDVKVKLRMLNLENSQFGDEKYCVDIIDFITFTSSLSSVPILNGSKTLLLHSITSMADVDDYTKLNSNSNNGGGHVVIGS